MVSKLNLQNANCFEIFKGIPNETIDLVLTDPPYGIKYNGQKWDNIKFIEFTEAWLLECNRVLKPTGTIWSFMGFSNIIDFIQLLDTNFNLHKENWVIWVRAKGRGASKHLKSTREDIFHATKGDKFTWNNLKVLREVITPYVKDGKPRGWFVDENGKRVRWTGLGNVWCYTSPFHKFNDDLALGHPHQKPIMLMERLLLLSSNEGDTILDPFMGTGTTGLVCNKWGRNFIGIEQDKEYFEIAKNRILN